MIKEFFGNYFGFSPEIARLTSLTENLGETVKYWHSQSEKHEKEYYSLKDEFEELLKPVDIPNANITYKRPVLIGKNEYKQIEIDVRNFIMPDFEMENKLKESNQIYDGTQDLDELIPKVYHLAKTNYKYEKDEQYGFSEYWMFPFELRAVLAKNRSGDCDDWANMIGSYFAAANIPRDRWLISTGIARAGYGHATDYAKDFIGVWRHLNSTKPEYDSKHLSGFPSNKDKNDKPGIKTDGFWFSYNDRFSVHEFESEEAKASFEKSKLKVSIKVVS